MAEAGAFTATIGIGQASCCGAGAVATDAVILVEGGRCIFCKAGDAPGVDPLWEGDDVEGITITFDAVEVGGIEEVAGPSLGPSSRRRLTPRVELSLSPSAVALIRI